MPNMEKIIRCQNQNGLMGKPKNNRNMCDSWKSDNGLINGKCLTENVMYRATGDVEVPPLSLSLR